MAFSFRLYQPHMDSEAITDLLTRTYPASDRHDNWLPARWEYMLHQGCGGDETLLANVGLWSHGERLVGAVTTEGSLGEAYFQLEPGYSLLKADMLAHACQNLHFRQGAHRVLLAYINAWDEEMGALAEAQGFEKLVDEPQWTSRIILREPLPRPTMPEGFILTDRAQRNEYVEINRVLWCGFDHEGPAEQNPAENRACVERAPLYRPELQVMVEAPEGHLVSYCGIWVHPSLKVAYVEPVATDPDYRRRGLGRAAVLEALRRAQAMGATRALVGSHHPFYLAMGFERHHCAYPWRKLWQATG